MTPPKPPRCPYCLDDLLPDQEMVRCADCRTPHHEGCFLEHQGCVAFGCAGDEQVEGGLSIFTKPAFKIRHEPTATVDFGPFVLGYRQLVAVPEKRPPRRCPNPYSRTTFELRELRESDTSAGRGVVYVPERTTYKRIDLYLFQGIQRPQQVARVTLVDAKDMPERVLERGSHPLHLELRAPPAIPFMDPFQLELVLVCGLFNEIRSLPLPLYLLQRRFQRTPPPLHVVPRPAAPPIRVQLRPPAPDVADAFPAPRAEEPSGWHPVTVTSVRSLYDSGDSTGRTVPVRFFPTPNGPRETLDVDVPSMPVAPEFPVRIAGGNALGSLNVAVHYELVRPGGVEVDHPGFPAMEEMRLLGESALEPDGYGGDIGVELILSIPPERLTALADARKGSAHNAALRLHIAVDAIDLAGNVLPPISRSVTLAPQKG